MYRAEKQNVVHIFTAYKIEIRDILHKGTTHFVNISYVSSSRKMVHLPKKENN